MPRVPALVSLLLLLACGGDDAADSGGGGPAGDGGSDGGADGGTESDGGATTDGGTDGGADGGTDGGADGGSEDGGSEDGGDGGDPVEITGEASVAANEYNQFSAIVTVTVDQDSAVTVHYGVGGLTHQTPAVDAVAGEPVEVLVLGLKADRSYQLQVEATAGEATWTSDPLAHTTAALPADWFDCRPTFTAPESDFDPDEVICTQGTTRTGTNVYYCTDYWGEPVFEAATPFNDSLMSMRPLADGSWVSTSFTSSRLVFLSRDGETTAFYPASWFEKDTRYTHEYIDSHEAYQIQDGIWAGAVAFYTNAYEWFPSGSYKLGNGLIIFDPDTREVLYDYSFHGELGDYLPMDEAMPYSRGGNGDYAEDWTHANTILHGFDPDGREYLLLSLKSQDWIFKLYPDTDELAWALGYDGDFTLVEDMDAEVLVERDVLDWAYHQHGVEFVEGDDGRLHLLMLDNGYPRHDGRGYRWDMYYSRIVQLRVDEATMLADIEFEWGSDSYSDPEYFFSATCGNTVLLQDGARVLTLDGEDATKIEVSYPEGEERWRMTCDTIQWCEYRVSWFPSLYETTWMYE